MVKLVVLLLVPYLAVASVATGVVNGQAALDAVRDLAGEVHEQSDEIATQILTGSSGLDQRVTVCHVPGANEANAHQLSVAMDALDTHLAHGDYDMSDPAVLAGPLQELCGDTLPTVDGERSSSNGNAPEHSNAGQGGPPEHSNAGGAE
jgi:hypothetical protein